MLQTQQLLIESCRTKGSHERPLFGRTKGSHERPLFGKRPCEKPFLGGGHFIPAWITHAG